MALSKKGFNLMAVILDMILYTKLHSEIGLKSAKVMGLSHLGMRVMKVAFKAPKTFPSNLDCSTALRISEPTSSNKLRKNSTSQPSGLGLLSFLNPLRTLSIYETVIS